MASIATMKATPQDKQDPSLEKAAAEKAAFEREQENAEDLALFRTFTASVRQSNPAPSGTNDADSNGADNVAPTVSAEAREAYTKLYLKYRQRVYAYCLRVLGDDGDAQDLFQEVFYRVYTRSHLFHEERSFGGWVFTIARNLCLNRVRDRKTNESIEDTDVSHTPSEDLGENWNDRIAWALQQLPLELREVFVLREYDGLTYDEIITIVHASMPAVKSRIFRAKDRLRQLLEPFYHEENHRSPDRTVLP